MTTGDVTLTVSRQHSQQRSKEISGNGVSRYRQPPVGQDGPQVRGSQPLCATPQRIAGPLPVVGVACPASRHTPSARIASASQQA